MASSSGRGSFDLGLGDGALARDAAQAIDEPAAVSPASGSPFCLARRVSDRLPSVTAQPALKAFLTALLTRLRFFAERFWAFV